MKAYGVVAILSIVLLTAAGYTITAWQHITLEEAHHAEEDHSGDTSHGDDVNKDDDHGTDTAGHDDDITETIGATAGAVGRTNSSSSVSGNTSASNVGTPIDTVSEEMEVSLVVRTEQSDEGATPLLTIELMVKGGDLNLNGWRLGDAIGVAGHPDHLFYFGHVELADGDTLTIHSSCGRDEGLTMYWCLSQPLTLLDSDREELFLLAGSEVALTCRSTSDEQTSSLDYECI